MTARDVLHAVIEAGGQIRRIGDTLNIKAPAPLSPTLLDQVRQHKPDLLALLSQDMVPPVPPAVGAGVAYCPGCASPALTSDGDSTRCTACHSWWLPAVDLNIDSPTAIIRVDHPAGHTVLVAVYRCPRCRDVRWGPRVDTPDVWCCLSCAEHAQRQPETHEAA